jgi:hypothetical protein
MFALLACMLAFQGCNSGAADPRVIQFSRLPAWSGVWVSEDQRVDSDLSGYSREEWKLLGRGAPWTAATRTAIERGFPGMAAHTAVTKAEGFGFPLMMEAPPPFEILVTPEQVLMVNLYPEVRHIYTDGRGHIPEDERWPTPWGDSTGHWEGDTLVVDTVSVQRPGIFSLPLPAVSGSAHYVERIRQTGPDRIESEMTIDDPATLTEPWHIKLSYLRARGIDRMFHNTFDNDRDQVVGDGMTIVGPHP